MVKPPERRRSVDWVEIGAPCGGGAERSGVAECSDVALSAAYWDVRRTAGRSPKMRAGAMLAICTKTASDE